MSRPGSPPGRCRGLALLRHAALWLALTGALTLAGALLGALLFPLAGTLLGMDLPPAVMARHGLHDGGLYTLIWAPGICLAAVVMRAHARSARARPPQGVNALDTPDKET